jgi:predicted nucleic acid-binding protein
VIGRGLTFDTGALIALERGEKRMRTVVLAAQQDGVEMTIPAVVLIEWWRDAPRQRTILEGLTIEPTSARVAKLAGMALGAVRGATAIDALVMASAAQRGDCVYTSDLEDLERLRTYFRPVRVLRA